MKTTIAITTIIAFAILWATFAKATNNAELCYFVALLHIVYALSMTKVYPWFLRKMRHFL